LGGAAVRNATLTVNLIKLAGRWALALSLFAFILTSQAYAGALMELFADPPSVAGVGDLGQQGADPTVVRERQVTINIQGLSSVADQAVAGLAMQPISLNLFPDVRHDFIPEKSEKSRDGKFTILSGSIAGGKPLMNNATFVFGDGVVTGNIRPGWGSVIYQVRTSPSGTPYVQEVDTSKFPAELEPIPAPPPAPPDAGGTTVPNTSTQGLNASAPVPDDGTTINVMVVYTPGAATAAGGTTAMQALINLGISETNQGYINSGVTQRITLAHSAEVVYTETDFGAALADVTGTTDGKMDNVHTLRNTYAADMVSLWINNSSSCGLAYLMTTASSSFAPSAFSVVHHGCATGYYSFAHEMGHNQGSHHDVFVAPGNGVYSYSHGYVDTGNSFRTIMAYANACVNCARINYWSNPNVNYTAKTTGAANANNTLSLNNTVSVAANWRASSAGSGGSLTVTISPTGAVTAGAQWNVDGGAWQASGATVSNLTAGTHTVSFNSVTGYTAPADQTVTVTAGQTTTAAGTYTINIYTVTVTATAGAGGAVAPPSQGITNGSTTTFTVTANTGYTRSVSVGGTCPAGYWSLTAYTTGAVTADCSVSFTFALKSSTTAAPAAVTDSPTNIAEKSVTFNGSVNPNGLSTTVRFQYGKTTLYGTPTIIVTLTGRVTKAVSANVTKLACGTTYHYRVIATNSKGTTRGPDVTFATSACVTPKTVTGVATKTTRKGATLNGTVNPRNASTTANFQYGKTTAYGSATPNVTLAGATAQAVTAALTGLTCGTTYHFRVTGVNSFGSAKGLDKTFITLACADSSADSNVSIPPVSDFDGDGKSDILLRDAVSGQTATWMMNGATVTSNLVTSMNAGAYTPTSGWQAQGLGDFDGDGKNDLLWRDYASGELAVWTMNGATVVNSATASVNPGAYTSTTGRHVQGIGDFNGDGKSDILWRNAGTGQTAVWFMNGAVVTSSSNTSAQATVGWQVNGVGDFNGDGKSDILWRQTGTGRTAVWYMNGAVKIGGGYINVQAGAYTSTTGWQVQGAGDFNGDGKADILLRSAETGRMAVWTMNGVKVVFSAYTSVDAGGLQVSAIGDYNGDGKTDILLRDSETGQTRVWIMNGSQVTSDTATDANPGAYTSSTGWNVVSGETVR
jgi:hypothetical protein